MMDLQTLKETIAAEIEKTKLPYDKGLEKVPFLVPNGECFEAIDLGNNKELYLFPEEGQKTFLFRGQTKEFIPCFPTIYRGNPSQIDIFINRMRLVQFERLLKTHPVVNVFFNKHHFHVDIEGLAQHYGLRTSVLDLTSSLDVALFFAMCPYDIKTDTYTCYNDGKEHNGIIYVFNAAYDNDVCPTFTEEQLFQKIQPIGFQAFARPGMQRGYGIHIKEGESIKCYLYRFRFTCDDSKAYLNHYQNGEKLWVKDELVEKAKLIATQTEFSFNLFGETFKKFRPKGFSRNKLKAELSRLIKLSSDCKDLEFSEDERKAIVDSWNRNQAQNAATHIVRRRWFKDGNDNDNFTHGPGYKPQIEEDHKYFTPEIISRINLLKTVAHVDPPLNAEWVNYMKTPDEHRIPKKYLDEGWKKVPSCYYDVKGKPWLTLEECRID